jgi:hypothetical protein
LNPKATAPEGRTDEKFWSGVVGHRCRPLFFFNRCRNHCLIIG